MSKAVLISIRPEWCEGIMRGHKTLELRKNRPRLEPPFKVYVYQTVPKWGDINDRQGRVFCEFICDKIIDDIQVDFKLGYYSFDNSMINVFRDTLLLPEQIYEYLKGKKGYGWHISDLVIYDKPKELREFSKYWDYFIDNQIPRPPQSWCYVEEL